jgi:Na+/H+ antiporter NhaD/arsenite permease-like protein
VRAAVTGSLLIVIGVLAIPLGVLTPDAAVSLGERVWPILAFVIAITVVTELASEAGLFRVLAEHAASWGLGRAWGLWLLVVILAVASTVFLSLDTTAVLLTPVVIVLARHVALSPVPFALTTVWLANTASLLLPVSNLTNLLAQHRLHDSSPLDFARLTWAPAVVAVVLPVVVIFVLFRRSLLISYRPEVRARVDDLPLLGFTAAVVVALLPALVTGVPPWIPAGSAAVLLGGAFFVRRRAALTMSLLPWQLVLLASGLFLAVEVAHALGLEALLSVAAGSGNGSGDLLRLAGVGAVGANAIDNLPAYLALEPLADSPDRLVALLIGVNAGPLVTPWASLATLLWHQRLTAMGVEISWPRYMLLGLVVAPVVVVAATFASLL